MTAIRQLHPVTLNVGWSYRDECGSTWRVLSIDGNTARCGAVVGGVLVTEWLDIDVAAAERDWTIIV
jgi:hypothetical protein